MLCSTEGKRLLLFLLLLLLLLLLLSLLLSLSLAYRQECTVLYHDDVVVVISDNSVYLVVPRLGASNGEGSGSESVENFTARTSPFLNL